MIRLMPATSGVQLASEVIFTAARVRRLHEKTLPDIEPYMARGAGGSVTAWDE